MAVATTGSLVTGTVQGLGLGLGNPIGEMVLVTASPNNLLTVVPGSGAIAYDYVNKQHYMGLAAGGSTWVKLGSVS